MGVHVCGCAHVDVEAKGWCLLSLSQVRLYDTRAQRRPIYSTEFGDSPVTALTVLEDGRCVLTWNVVTLP